MNEAHDPEGVDGAPLRLAAVRSNQTQPLVSVITPTYNRRDSLLATLRALEQQSLPADQFETLVIADGCTDGTEDACRALRVSYTLRVIEQPNAGPAVARNVGCQEARAPLLVFLDDDVIPDPDFLAAHIQLHEQAAGRVVIGPLLLPPQARLQPWVHWELDRLERQYDDMASGKWAPTPRQFYTGNASVAREAVLAAGGFNADFRRAEDVELAYRLQARDYTFVFAPQARGWHYARRGFSSWKAIASAYGQADAMMAQALGMPWILRTVGEEFHKRSIWLQLLARACIPRKPLFDAAVAGGGVMANLLSRFPGRLGYRLSGAGYSMIFNLLFWEGVTEAIGVDAFWELVRHNAIIRGPTPASVSAAGRERETVANQPD
jgi:GT2 family glycosyltransferase